MQIGSNQPITVARLLQEFRIIVAQKSVALHDFWRSCTVKAVQKYRSILISICPRFCSRKPVIFAYNQTQSSSEMDDIVEI